MTVPEDECVPLAPAHALRLWLFSLVGAAFVVIVVIGAVLGFATAPTGVAVARTAVFGQVNQSFSTANKEQDALEQIDVAANGLQSAVGQVMVGGSKANVNHAVRSLLNAISAADQEVHGLQGSGPFLSALGRLRSAAEALTSGDQSPNRLLAELQAVETDLTQIASLVPPLAHQ